MFFIKWFSRKIRPFFVILFGLPFRDILGNFVFKDI